MILPSLSGSNKCGTKGFCHRRESYQGFNYVSASVTIPCESVKTAPGESGYAYVGSVGSTNILEVDAGIQLQTTTDPKYAPLSVQAYMAAAGGAITVKPAPSHFVCSPTQTITEQFQPLAFSGTPPNGSQDLMLVDSGLIMEGGATKVTVMASFTHIAGPEIQLTSCPTCEVKRVTALATTRGNPDGSFVGVNNATTNNPSPAVAWTGSLHGNATAAFGFAQNVGAFYEVNQPGNNVGPPPIELCTIPSSPPPDGSQNETVGLNYEANAQNGPTCSVDHCNIATRAPMRKLSSIATWTFSFCVFLMVNPVTVAAAQLGTFATFRTAWQVKIGQTISNVFTGARGLVTIVITPDSISGRSSSTGATLWRRTETGFQAAVCANRLYFVSSQRRLVSLDVWTGKVMWETSRIPGTGDLRPDLVSVGANEDTAVVGMEPPNAEFAPGEMEMTLAFSASDGRRRWQRQENAGRIRKFIFLPHLLLSTFFALGEPTVDQVDVIDLKSGSIRLSVTGARYVDNFNGEFWLSDDDTTTFANQYVPARFIRYRQTDAKRLGEFIYAPDPTRNAAGYAGSVASFAYGLPVPTLLTSKWIFLQVGNALYRYDRWHSPAGQRPWLHSVHGILTAVIDDSPVVIDRAAITVFTPATAAMHAVSVFSISTSLLKGYGVGPLLRDAQGVPPTVVASSEGTVFIDVPSGLLAILKEARVFAPPKGLFEAFGSIRVLPSGATIAQCGNRLVKFFRPYDP